MKTWSSVGIVAFVVMSLTATLAAAAPSAQADRAWLRTANKAAPKAEGRSELGLGKWAAVACLVGLGGFLLWKRRDTKGTSAGSVSKMKILSVTRLSTKAQIVAVEIQGRTLLVGATDTTVTRLGWLEDPEPSIEEAPEDEDDDGPSTNYGRPQTRGQGLAAASRPAARAEAVARPVPAKAKAAPRATSQSSGPSRFRELLADAIGIEPRVNPRKPQEDTRAAVDEIAATTRDRYVGRTESRQNTQKITRSLPRTTALIDVEGQAKGLLARLNRPET